jgi:PPK2 family polyphosphate:nucleotide phosphotransferase
MNQMDIKVTGKIKLDDFSTSLETDLSKEELAVKLSEVGEKLSRLQDTMYAHDRYSVLIVLQGMDTAGKDSLIREVFSKFNPRGVVVSSFKKPSEKELQHDYLWRHYVALPEKGKFAIFNRSHYENVLVTRVNPHLILNENLPGINSVDDIDDNFWERRFNQINQFENHIIENGTIVFKFFLHLGKEEQRKRLLRRLNNEKHNWKFSPYDIAERQHWDKYQACYEEAISKTASKSAPWYIIPADNKALARLMVAETIFEKLSGFTDIREPELDPKIKENLHQYRKMLDDNII